MNALPLNVDLWCLIASVLLAFTLLMPVLVARSSAPNGLPWGWSNRENKLEGVAAWGERAVRAHQNLLENLPAFAIVVLVVQLTGHANRLSALGAELFVAARVLHAIMYIAGIKYVRSFAYFVGLAATFLIAAQLL